MTFALKITQVLPLSSEPASEPVRVLAEDEACNVYVGLGYAESGPLMKFLFISTSSEVLMKLTATREMTFRIACDDGNTRFFSGLVRPTVGHYAQVVTHIASHTNFLDRIPQWMDAYYIHIDDVRLTYLQDCPKCGLKKGEGSCRSIACPQNYTRRNPQPNRVASPDKQDLLKVLATLLDLPRTRAMLEAADNGAVVPLIEAKIWMEAREAFVLAGGSL